jgi:hypothetical protein
VHHQIGAELDGAVNVGAGEGIVHDKAQVVTMCERGGAGQIGQPHDGVRGGFHEQHARRGADFPFDLVEIRGVDPREGNGHPRQHLVEEPERAAVGVLRDDDVVARLEQRADGADRRHARGKREPRLAALDGRDVALEREARRILRARVLVALVHAELVLHVGRCLIDRRDDGAGRRIRFLTCVQADGAEARGLRKSVELVAHTSRVR